jgi:phospholipase/carboxylesterase
MSERTPSPGQFFDWGIRWQLPEWSDDETDIAASELDFDQVPTRAERDAGITGPVISVTEGPHAIALPEIYEPSYAYPLIVWFHQPGSNEEEVFDVLPQISDRNYVALALRGNVDAGDHAEWSTSAESSFELAHRIEEAVSNFSGFVSVHPQRVYLAGAGTGGTTALELLLQRPETFAGAICLGGAFPDGDLPLARYRELLGRRILLATTLESREAKVADLVNSGRLLYTAGMQVGTRVYQPGGDVPTPKMLRDVDHWIMDSIQSAIRVSVR